MASWSAAKGRQIDVVQPPWTKFQNYDVYIKIEIDFDPVLDELLQHHHVEAADPHRRRRCGEKLRADGKNAGGLSRSCTDHPAAIQGGEGRIDAMIENVTKQAATRTSGGERHGRGREFKTKTPAMTTETREEAERNLEEVSTRAQGDRPQPRRRCASEVEDEIEEASLGHRVQGDRGRPVLYPEALGEQKRIVLNTAHPFYSRLYAKASGDVTVGAGGAALRARGRRDRGADGWTARSSTSPSGTTGPNCSRTRLTSLVPQGALDDETSLGDGNGGSRVERRLTQYA